VLVAFFAENLGAGLAPGPIAALWFSLKHDNSGCSHHIEIVVEILPAPADFGSGLRLNLVLVALPCLA
jgi:hypothetical protein